MDSGKPTHNLNVTYVGDKSTHHALSSTSQAAKMKHDESMRKLEIQNASRSILVPVSDIDVKIRLRVLLEPITLFGEQAGDRRERQRMLLATLAVDKKLETFNSYFTANAKAVETSDVCGDKPYLVACTNAKEVMLMRKRVLEESVQVSEMRQQKEQLLRRNLGLLDSKEVEDEQVQQNRQEYIQQIDSVNEKVGKYSLYSNTLADARVLSSVSMNDTMLASGSWNGSIKVWNRESNAAVYKLKGHIDRVHDQLFLNHTSTLASCGIDGVYLWNVPSVDRNEEEADMNDEEEQIKQERLASFQVQFKEESVLEDAEEEQEVAEEDRNQGFHQVDKVLQKKSKLQQIAPSKHFHTSARVNRMAQYHNVLAATSHNNGFHLYDVPTGCEILFQVGHSAPTYGIAAHTDGSLLAVGDYGALVRCWDTRSGRVAMNLEGHTNSVLGCSFGTSMYSHLLATASTDRSVRLWDLRMNKALYTYAAHTNVCSDVQIHPDKPLLLSTGYDGQTMVHSILDYSRICTLTSNTKVMRGIWHANTQNTNSEGITTVHYDCNIRQWK